MKSRERSFNVKILYTCIRNGKKPVYNVSFFLHAHSERHMQLHLRCARSKVDVAGFKTYRLAERMA